MMSSGRNRFPFTATQWQELEHQALIFKYMITGMPIPPHLLYTIRRTLDSSLSSKLLLHHQPPQIGWSCFQMGFGRKIDPEPGRCRRTDGKKWRCSKEAYPDSKYCERHMHRGRNRSRKPVELSPSSTNNPSFIPTNACPSPTSPSSSSSHHSVSCLTSLVSDSHQQHSHHHHHHHHHHPSAFVGGSSNYHQSFLYPQSTSQDNAIPTTKFLWESSAAAYSGSRKDYSGQGGGKVEVDHEIPFFSENSGAMRSISGIGGSMHDSWQLSMGSPLSNLKQRPYSEGHHSFLQLHSPNNDNYLKHNDYCELDSGVKNEVSLALMDDNSSNQPKKVMHHFFDEWPPKDKDSWLDSDDKLSIHSAASSKIQLSISVPNSSHDFFFANKNDK